VIRRKTPEPENHDRWLVSYADFITLLFAFFVVMFATAQSDKAKTKEVSEAVREAFQHGQLSSAFSSVMRGRPDPRKPGNTPPKKSPANLLPPPPADLTGSLDTLQRELAAELNSGKVQLKLEGRGLVISMREAAFFASGDNIVAPASFSILAKIAAVVQSLPNQVRLEGYTDSIPIHNSRFRNNWELSAARSIAMLELLGGRYQIDTARLSVAGYGENAPSDTNQTVEGRAHNRRVDLVLLSADGMKVEPQAGPR
jgi:chemotaxis protein MotB